MSTLLAHIKIVEGHEEKFEVIITLQPIAGFGNKILTHQEKINSLIVFINKCIINIEI